MEEKTTMEYYANTIITKKTYFTYLYLNIVLKHSYKKNSTHKLLNYQII